MNRFPSCVPVFIWDFPSNFPKSILPISHEAWTGAKLEGTQKSTHKNRRFLPVIYNTICHHAKIETQTPSKWVNVPG